MPKIVSMGVHILDVLGRHVSEIPPGQNIALIDEIRITAAGTAAGTAVDMAKLGCKVVAVGAAGDDEMGNVLLGIMNRYGIDTSYMKRKKGVQTSGTMLPIRPNGERPALHVMGTNATFCFEDVPQDVVRNADFVHIGGFYLMPKFDGEDTVKTLKVAREGKAITTMDILGIKQDNMAEKILPTMPYLDYFMPNLEEAQMITGLTDLDALCDFFLNAGAKHVVLKMGARGSLIKDKAGMRLRIPAFKVAVVDTTGCGDAWTGGFIAGLSRGMTIEEAAQLGSACGSLVATGLGSDAGIIDFDSTMKFAQTNPTLPLGD
ncbi:MAG: sugar kinase [Candidatus Nanopelagicales bacterium]|nr:sugar kinase [Candidatus Nanopelagicales bacterium]